MVGWLVAHVAATLREIALRFLNEGWAYDEESTRARDGRYERKE